MILILLIALIIIQPLFAQYKFSKQLRDISESNFEEAKRIRRILHQMPEPCYQEEKTAGFIEAYLENLGLEVIPKIGNTQGIKAILHGTEETPVVAIRADMDALPIEEATGLTWTSQNQGFMHACGHDIHMTNGLMAARILTELKDEIPGTVVFIFQPCEEGSSNEAPGGAETLVNAGILENPKVNAIFGLHVMPGYPIGSVAMREGPIMANVATVRITIHGKSSHGAYPHQGVDAVYAAATGIVQFQSLISRMKDPKEQAVLSIGKISGGTRFNVIADQIYMEGTVRSFSEGTEKLIEDGIEKILEGLVISLGIHYDYAFSRGSKYVKNDTLLTSQTRRLFESILNKENVYTTPPVTVAEDFSFYSHKIPASFFFLGAGKGTLHHPEFCPDDEMLKYGGMLLASAAVEFLISGSGSVSQKKSF